MFLYSRDYFKILNLLIKDSESTKIVCKIFVLVCIRTELKELNTLIYAKQICIELNCKIF